MQVLARIVRHHLGGGVRSVETQKVCTRNTIVVALGTPCANATRRHRALLFKQLSPYANVLCHLVTNSARCAPARLDKTKPAPRITNSLFLQSCTTHCLALPMPHTRRTLALPDRTVYSPFRTHHVVRMWYFIRRSEDTCTVMCSGRLYAVNLMSDVELTLISPEGGGTNSSQQTEAPAGQRECSPKGKIV